MYGESEIFKDQQVTNKNMKTKNQIIVRPQTKLTSPNCDVRVLQSISTSLQFNKDKIFKGC